MTGFELRRLVEAMMLPPGSILLLTVLALVVVGITQRCRVRFLYFLMSLLWLVSTPWFAFQLLEPLQRPFAPLLEVPKDADVIVLLSGGHYESSNEFGSDAMPSGPALERAHYSAWLARKTGLPIIVSGGSVTPEEKSEASILSAVLRNQLDVQNVLEEARSKNTEENAKFTKALMREKGFSKPLLVTHYWHMPRVMNWFRYHGIDAYAAPTARYAKGPTERKIWQWVPQAKSLNYLSIALHEYLGVLHYRYRLFTRRPSVNRHRSEEGPF
ncbi:MAG: hypothetical protein DSZ28_00380 [Thiothrix sp.]|nr:MAG: hypothetical protein DSZ28_00380 [Thiothrix sp.]